jgi:LDH2 family malate/lactate/ureidoglycolate dehydrogenase
VSERYAVEDLRALASTLLEHAGLPSGRSTVVADILVEGDLLGHTTHGLQLLETYLSEIESGYMTTEGDPEVVADRGASVVWDGKHLPGPWLVNGALELGWERIGNHPVVTFVIRRSHHIACLSAYLKRATDRKLVMLLMTSGPVGASVAPYGGLTPVYSPNPLAAGFPTDGDPVLLDVSMSTTTNSMVKRLNSAGERLPGRWLIDRDGRATDDPNVLFEDPPGAILPLGGTDLGHKGYALGLLVEVLTSALSGFGRADRPERWSDAVFIQLIDPAAFGGYEAFIRETGWLARACRNSEPIPGTKGVRLPGQAGLARRAAALEKGVELAPTVMPGVRPWAEKLGVPLPFPL